MPLPGVGGGMASPVIDTGLDVVHDVGMLLGVAWRASSRARFAASSASICPITNSFFAWPALRASLGSLSAPKSSAATTRCR